MWQGQHMLHGISQITSQKEFYFECLRFKIYLLDMSRGQMAKLHILTILKYQIHGTEYYSETKYVQEMKKHEAFTFLLYQELFSVPFLLWK